MEIPDIPDNRPHKSPSVLSYSPTIVLHEATEYGFEPRDKDTPQDLHQDASQSLGTPEPRPKSILQDSRQEMSQYLGTPEPQEQSKELGVMPNGEEQEQERPSPHDADELHSKGSLKMLRRNFTLNELPLLQATNPYDGSEQFNPVNEEDGDTFDLVAPYEGDAVPLHTLERQADTMFSPEHMLTILRSPCYLARFRDFLVSERPRSITTLTYYLNACKALKAIQYANALVRLSVDVPTAGIESAEEPVGPTTNSALETRVQDALNALTAEELPAFITATCINITSKVVEEQVRGTLPDKFQGTSDALAEVFCLTDPSRPDNPIIFASGEFHRTTQYGMDYVLGRNCRFLQGPKTNQNSVRRIREGIKSGRHHSELFLNYRRDGSPFMNLLQCAPLCDSQGKIRYFIGAQIDVSGLAMEGAQMESLQDLQSRKVSEEEDNTQQGASQASVWQGGASQADASQEAPPQELEKPKSEFQELGELFSPRELQNVHDYGGNLFHPVTDRPNPKNSRLWLQSPEGESEARLGVPPSVSNGGGSLTGVYKHYLLVRPYPSLRILFTSPSLQIPGMLQSSFLSRIGDSGHKRDSILQAIMAGRSVTARIKWVTRFSDRGRHRWIHCTPLLANNGEVGVWMVVVIDDEDEQLVRWRGNWPSA